MNPENVVTVCNAFMYATHSAPDLLQILCVLQLHSQRVLFTKAVNQVTELQPAIGACLDLIIAVQ